MEMGIHPNHFGMIPHHLETCRKGHFIKKVIIFKDKGERIVGILQRDVNLRLERRAVTMAHRLNNIKIQADSIGLLTVLPHPNI